MPSMNKRRSDETDYKHDDDASRHCNNSPTDAASTGMQKQLEAFVAINAATSDLSLPEMHARLHSLHGALSAVVGVRAGVCAE